MLNSSFPSRWLFLAKQFLSHINYRLLLNLSHHQFTFIMYNIFTDLKHSHPLIHDLLNIGWTVPWEIKWWWWLLLCILEIWRLLLHNLYSCYIIIFLCWFNVHLRKEQRLRVQILNVCWVVLNLEKGTPSWPVRWTTLWKVKLLWEAFVWFAWLFICISVNWFRALELSLYHTLSFSFYFDYFSFLLLFYFGSSNSLSIYLSFIPARRLIPAPNENLPSRFNESLKLNDVEEVRFCC